MQCGRDDSKVATQILKKCQRSITSEKKRKRTHDFEKFDGRAFFTYKVPLRRAINNDVLVFCIWIMHTKLIRQRERLKQDARC